MKLSVIGGGSTYTPELIDGIGREKEVLGFTEICLFDPDEKRLAVLAEFCARLLKALRSPVKITTTANLAEALDGAFFTVSQIRVGGQAARQKDTELGLRHDLIGQETTGCGGFACGLRHIPASLNIVREMEKRCPEAPLINFTNPAGMVTEALCQKSRIQTIGICNVPWVMAKDIADFYHVPFETVKLDYFGLNHLSWATRITVGGEDKTRDVLKNYRQLHSERYNFPPDLVTAIEALPSPYLRYYYLAPLLVGRLKQALKTRAQEVMEIEGALLKRYADPGVSEKPPELLQRGGIHYGQVAVGLIKAMLGKDPVRQIVNLPNGNVFPWLPQDAVIEFPFWISKKGFVPESTPEVPVFLKALIQQVKTYEQLAVKAALTGDRKAAYQALLVNPLVGAAKAKVVLEELLEMNQPYLPQFQAKPSSSHEGVRLL